MRRLHPPGTGELLLQVVQCVPFVLGQWGLARRDGRCGRGFPIHDGQVQGFSGGTGQVPAGTPYSAPYTDTCQLIILPSFLRRVVLRVVL